MIEAHKIETGMTFHDGSTITVISETKCFITVELSNGFMMENTTVTRKWRKTSMINLR